MGDPGVNDYSVSLDTQEVIVKGTLPYEDVYAKIQKTGKEVRRSSSGHGWLLILFPLRSLVARRSRSEEIARARQSVSSV